MTLRNSAEDYGLISRLLHWAIALLILFMLGFGTWLANSQITPARIWLFGLHKSLGLTIFALALLRLGWHRYTPPPVPLGEARTWQRRLAGAVHRLLYLLMLAVPISGWIFSEASGIRTVVFGLWTLPQIVPASDALSDWGFTLHGLLTKLMMALLLLHVAGALRHGMGRGSALRRITSG
ncbi:cytochrome b [Thioclava sp. BHET1]|nr:cytochrome b [Thioclava sp. BHET1]